MTTASTEEIWDALAGRRVELVRGFYDRLFERYPRYRALFPQSMDQQMEKMVEILSAVIRFSAHIDLIRPYLLHAARAHRALGIDTEDLRNFTDVLVEAVGEACPERWTEENAQAWHRALDDVVIPIFEEGLAGRNRP